MVITPSCSLCKGILQRPRWEGSTGGGTDSVAPACFRYTLKLKALVCLLSQGSEEVPHEGEGEMLGLFPLPLYNPSLVDSVCRNQFLTLSMSGSCSQAAQSRK